MSDRRCTCTYEFGSALCPVHGPMTSLPVEPMTLEEALRFVEQQAAQCSWADMPEVGSQFARLAATLREMQQQVSPEDVPRDTVLLDWLEESRAMLTPDETPNCWRVDTEERNYQRPTLRAAIEDAIAAEIVDEAGEAGFDKEDA